MDTSQEAAAKKIAKALNIPVSQVYPEYATVMQSRGDADVETQGELTGFRVRQGDLQTLFDTAGNQTAQDTARTQQSFWEQLGDTLGDAAKIGLVAAGAYYALPALAGAFGGSAAAGGLAAGELGLAGGTGLGAGNLGVAGAMGGTFAPAISAPVTNAMITGQALDALPAAYSSPVYQGSVVGAPIGGLDAGTSAAMQGGFGNGGAGTVAPLGTYAPGTLGSGGYDAVGNLLSTGSAPAIGQGATLAPAAVSGTGAMGAGMGGAATDAAGNMIGTGAAAGTNALTGAGNSITNFLTSPAGIQTAASLLGGAASAFGSNAAANTQASAADRALALQQEIYESQKGLQEPYRAAGLTAQNRMLDLLGLSKSTGQADYGRYARDFGMSDFQADPGYAFRLKTGQEALERTAAARGGLMSGGALKAAARYGQEMASQEYSNAFNRYQTNRSNQLQPLGNLMASGQNAASNVGAAAGQYGTAGGNLMQSGGQATAAGQLGIGNTINNAIGASVSAYQNNNLLDMLRRQNTNANPYANPYA